MRETPIPPQTTSDADLRGVIRLGGGAREWIWKGARELPASIELVVNNPKGTAPLRHRVAFQGDERGFSLHDERIENDMASGSQIKPQFYYRFEGGHPVLNDATNRKRTLVRESVNLDLSILAQRRDPEMYPEITHLAEAYEKWRLYREWVFGRDTVFRDPQKADMRNDRLEEDFFNLGLFLSRLRKTLKAKKAIQGALMDLYEGLTDFDVLVEGGSVQVFFTEGDFSIPATRLSDGTLRYLCLAAILCDPDPPPLICIEEPEFGLHPDILPKVADLLSAAAQRTQIVVTTHSDILVDAMTEQPEVVVVCEKHEGQTEMRRLKKDDLAAWLDKYRLGQLWTKGSLEGFAGECIHLRRRWSKRSGIKGVERPLPGGLSQAAGEFRVQVADAPTRGLWRSRNGF